MTGYVVTRWYRAPEVIFNWMHYSQTGKRMGLTCCLIYSLAFEFVLDVLLTFGLHYSIKNVTTICQNILLSFILIFYFNLLIKKLNLYGALWCCSCTVDVWSAACILAELITGQVLFPGDDSILQLVLSRSH